MARAAVYGRSFMAVTGHSLASLAAVECFKRGGNVVDAAIAASAATASVLHHAAGIGGDCFLLYRDGRSGKTYGLNASGTAPALATPDRFADGMKAHGALAPLVPGLVRAWDVLHRRFGKMEWRILFGDAIALAEAHPASQVAATRAEAQRDELLQDAGAAALYLPGGRAIGIGETLRQPALAATLRTIANDGADAFYTGAIAARIDALFKKNDGLLRAADLASYQPLWVEPIATDYRGHRIEAMPPNSCGALLLMQLNGLSAIDSAVLAGDAARRMAYQMSAMKAAFAVGVPHIADPAFAPDATALLLSDEMAAVMRESVLAFDNRRAGADSGGTSCLIFADAEGNAVSLVQSIFNVFGACLRDPETGILFNNRMSGFTHKPDRVNTVGPGKRPAHTLCPVMVTQGDRLRYALATPGGLSQTLTNVQVLNHLIDRGMDPQAAVEAPRWCNTKTGDFLIENEFAPEMVDALQRFGHKAKRRDDGYFYGSAKVVAQLANGNLAGGADHRREGFALGY
jgi:gamma-glutamyltranspeptidase/glutathione hydrolase